MEGVLNLGALAGLGISVGMQWGFVPAIAAVCAAYLLMPYHYSTYKR